MKKKNAGKVIAITAAVICVMAVVVFMIISSTAAYAGVSWKEKELSCGRITISLKNKKISIRENGKLTWTSRKEYKVEDLLLNDIDGDGDTEMTALLWKRGKYGSSRPFWESGEDNEWTQHIFIYDIDDKGDARSKWFASDIGMQVRRMAFTDDTRPILLLEDINGNSSASSKSRRFPGQHN